MHTKVHYYSEVNCKLQYSSLYFKQDTLIIIQYSEYLLPMRIPIKYGETILTKCRCKLNMITEHSNYYKENNLKWLSKSYPWRSYAKI